MTRLAPMLLAAAMAAAAVAAPAEKYFYGLEERKCTPSGDRCAGEHLKPYVKYASCCEAEAVCAEKPELGWGLFCYKGGKKCYGPNERCAGTKDHWIFEKGCCGDYKCEPNAEMGWGSFCVANYTPVPGPTDYGAPATTAAPAASDPPSYYVDPATTAAPTVPDAPSYYVDQVTSAAPTVPDAPSYYVAPVTTAAPAAADYAPSYEATPATTDAPKKYVPAATTDAPKQYVPAATTEAPPAYEPSTAPPSYADEPATTAAPSASYSCGTWVGSDNKVVIDTQGSASGNWQNQGDGIMYKPWNHDPHHIVGAGDSPITYRYVVPAAGEYMVTFVSSSPMQNEHNDCWLRSDGGLSARKPGHSTGYTTSYAKAYSNAGYGSKELRTVDHDPHTFVTRYMQAGEEGSVTIAGRSSQFKIHKIVLAKCGATCYAWDPAVSSALHHLTPSTYKQC